MEWDLLGGVVQVRVEVQAEEVGVLAGWVVTVLGLVPAEIVYARIVERDKRIRQVFLATT
jgi:hypothetical protein